MVVGDTVETIDLDHWDLAQDVKICAMYLLSRAAVPAMRGRRRLDRQYVVCVGLPRLLGRPSHAYAASKGAVLALTHEMAASYGLERIRVSAICPGTIRTWLTADIIAAAQHEAADIARRTLFLRLGQGLVDHRHRDRSGRRRARGGP